MVSAQYTTVLSISNKLTVVTIGSIVPRELLGLQIPILLVPSKYSGLTKVPKLSYIMILYALDRRWTGNDGWKSIYGGPCIQNRQLLDDAWQWR